MLQIYRDGNKLIVRLNHHINKKFCSQFEESFDNEVSAELYRSDLFKAMRTELERIRKYEYAQGWKDAKAKRKKKSYFDMGWHTHGMES